MVLLISTMVFCIFGLHYIGLNLITSYIISVIVALTVYIVYFNLINAQLRKILDSECDPEKYLIKIDKMDKRRSRNYRYSNTLQINRAAAYMILGNYEEGKKYLDIVDVATIVKNNAVYSSYIVNKVICHYELGELQEAERLFETEVVLLRLFDNRIYKSIEILIGERYFFLEQYDKSYQQLIKLLNIDLGKRQYLEILFRLAHMDIIQGETESASKKLKKIVRLGNKIGIVKEAQEMLAKIERSL